MKELKRRLITGLLAFAMVFSNMPGMGMLVANAEVDTSVINLHVVDTNGNAVANEDFTFESSEGDAISFSTDSAGNASKSLTGLNVLYGDYTLYLGRSSTYTIVGGDIVVSLVDSDGDWKPDYVDTVNEKGYTGVINVTLKSKNATADPEPPAPELPAVDVYGISADKTSLESAGGDITVTITSLDWPTGEGKVYCNVVNKATGEDLVPLTEKTVSKTNPSFVINFPENTSASDVGYTIKVNGTTNMMYPQKVTVTVAAPSSGGDDTPANPELPAVDVYGISADKTSLESAGGDITVTVTSLDWPTGEGKVYCNVVNKATGEDLVPLTEKTVSKTNPSFVISFPENTSASDVGYTIKVNGTTNMMYPQKVTVTVAAPSSGGDDTPVVDRTKFVVKAVDAEGNPVQGVKIALKGSWSNYDAGTTGANGEATIKVNSSWYGNYTVTTVENSGYQVAGDPSTINIGAGSIQDEYGNYLNELKTVNGLDYDGSPIQMTVEQAVVEPDPEVKSVTCDPMTIGEDGGTVTVKISGTKLPASMYYKVFCNADDGDGKYYDNNISGYAGTAVSASGNTEERTFTVNIPAISSLSYNDIQGFKVAVGIVGEYANDYKKSEMIKLVASEEPPQPSAPDIDSVEVNVDTAERQNQEVTVTVKGTALPEKLHYDIWSQTSNNVQNPAVSDTVVTAEGSATERTFTITLPDADNSDDVKFWRVRVAIDPNDGYVAKEIAVKAPADPDQPAAKINTVTAKVVDSNGQPVEGVTVSLYDTVLNFEYKKPVTDSEGKASYTFGKHDDSSYTLRIKAGQAVTCDTEYALVVENGGYISTVNGEAVTEAKELVFQVAADASAPEITSIEPPASMTKDTSSVDVKIVGKNLPESFRCKLEAKYDDGQGGFATNGSFKTVTANAGGSDTERTVTLETPYCANPVFWEVTVQIPDYSITKTATIAVATEQEKPSIDKNSLDAAISDAESLVSAEYTESTWTAFAKALADAKTVQKNDTATQNDVNAAVTALANAKAALVSNRILNIKVIDENGDPVELADDELWLEKSDALVDDYYFAGTDKNGMISLDIKEKRNEVQILNDTFTFRLAREGYELKDTTTLKTVLCESCYFKPAMIDKVNDKEYTGLVTLVVKKSGEPDQPAEPVITRIEVPETLPSSSTETTVTVIGENLPDTLWVKGDSYWNDVTGEAKKGGDWAEVEATGSSTQKTVTVAFPSVSKAVKWDVAIKPVKNSSATKATILAASDESEQKKPSITSISFEKTVFDSKGGTVSVTLDGENLDVIDLKDITAKVFLAGNATATDIPVSVESNDSGKPVLTFIAPANETGKTQNYILKVYYKSSEVIVSTDRENKQVVAVLPAGSGESDQTLGAMTISAVGNSSGSDLKNAVAEVSPQLGSLKVEIRLYGTNLDNKRTKIRAIDENNILWPVYDVPECDGTWRFIAIAGTDKNGIFGQGNSQLIELLPPRYAGTNKRYTIQVSIDGENWITAEEDLVTLTVNNADISNETDFRNCGAEDIKTLTINYVDESGKKIADSDEYRGYGITMVQQFGIAPKTIEGYTLVEEKNPSFPEWMHQAKDSYSYVYKADNAGGGTSGGGGGAAPSEPEKDVITNTGSGDSTSTNVDVTDKTTTSEAGKAETTIDTDLGGMIVDNAVKNNASDVVIKAETSKGDAAGSTVILPETTVQDIAKKTDASVTIKTDNASVSLDKKAVNAVASQAGTDGEVKLVVETKEHNKNKVEIELKLETSNGEVTDFKGGNVTVTVPVSDELAGKKIVCVYIDENGKYTKMEGKLAADGKSYTFTTGHFSTYAILEEAEADAVIAEQNKAEAPAVKVAKASVKLKAYKGGKLKVTASAKNATGYRVYYKKSTWKKYKTYTKGNVKTLNKTFRKLSKGKYTVKVKAYNKAANGKVTWGTISGAKKITVRK